MDSPVPDAEPEMELVDQPFAVSEMGESMDASALLDSPVFEIFWTYEFSKVQGFLVDLASHGVPEEI